MRRNLHEVSFLQYSNDHPLHFIEVEVHCFSFTRVAFNFNFFSTYYLSLPTKFHCRFQISSSQSLNPSACRSWKGESACL